jgi:hypothetical protein
MSVPAGAFAARHADSHGHRPQRQLDLRKHARAPGRTPFRQPPQHHLQPSNRQAGGATRHSDRPDRHRAGDLRCRRAAGLHTGRRSARRTSSPSSSRTPSHSHTPPVLPCPVSALVAAQAWTRDHNGPSSTHRVRASVNASVGRPAIPGLLWRLCVPWPVRAVLRPVGKPTYISGPHDDGEKVIRKLRRGLGDGNYDFVHMISG